MKHSITDLALDVAEVVQRVEYVISRDQRDWSRHPADAWLYGVLVGWDCEVEHDHDDTCNDGVAMTLVAERHGWLRSQVTRLRAERGTLLDLLDAAADAVDPPTSPAPAVLFSHAS